MFQTDVPKLKRSRKRNTITFLNLKKKRMTRISFTLNKDIFDIIKVSKSI